MLYNLTNDIINTFEIIRIPDSIKNIIKNYCELTINKYLPKYNNNERIIIIDFLVSALYYLMKGLNIETESESDIELEVFMKQISMNNDRNLLAIVNLILPYLDDKNDNYNQKNIKSFLNTIENENQNKEGDNKIEFCNYIYDHSFIQQIKEENIIGSDIKKLKFEIKNKFPETETNIIRDITKIYYSTIFSLILEIFNKTRYKFYINWINSFPINLDNYKNTKLYKNSFKYNEVSDLIQMDNELLLIFPNYFISKLEYKKLIDNDYIHELTKHHMPLIKTIINQSDIYREYDYNGINLEDIYNTLVNDYYHNIKRNKWLIFEVDNNNVIILIIQILHDILNIDNIINDKQWNILNESQQDLFEKNWIKMITALQKQSNLMNYSYEILKSVLSYFVSYFEFHYNEINFLVKNNKYIKLPNSSQEIEEEELEIEGEIIKIINKKNFDNMNIIEFINAIKNVPAEHIYNFLYNEINEIKNTSYKHLLFDDNGLKNLKFNKINLNDTDSYILTPKNYYNFSKSLLYKNIENEDNEDKILSILWDGLAVEEKYAIAIRLNQNFDNQKWFDIKNILKKINYTDNIQKYTEVIYQKIRKNLIDLTFENLIRKGCICKFMYNPEVSDSKILTENYETKNKTFADNMKKYVLTNEKIKEYEKAYYYVNNKQYNKQSPIIIRKTEEINYIEYLSKPEITEDTWNTFYAMDWVSQIDFYMKFINQRVMYVTGATGQGKSTQVPKLYLYGLKSFLYKNNGKILCTAPRIDPVTNNTETISKSMGVPYKVLHTIPIVLW